MFKWNILNKTSFKIGFIWWFTKKKGGVGEVRAANSRSPAHTPMD